jgi:glutathione synthase/RimK-type ligase-like ATP-grasp enzyme
LRVAQQAGLAIPNTSVTNNSNINLISDEQYIVKSLDTALFYKDKQEMFTYSNMVCGKDINSSNLQNAPVIIQNYLPNKVDLRVSIVGGELFPIKILTKQNENIVGDWRKTKKDELSYIPVDLPQLIQDKILNVMKQLELNFGGLDLICSNGEYYFIEVNPTGEWGWLVSNAKLPIDKKITDLLLN